MLLSALSDGHLRSGAPPTAADGPHARLATADSKSAKRPRPQIVP